MIILKDCTWLCQDIADTRLDHWLSANASMAVGSLTGPALDSTAFQPMPNPNSFDPNVMINPNPTLSSPYPTTGQGWDLNMTPSVNMDWSQPQTLNQMQGQGQVQFGTLGADNGLAFGATGVMVAEGGGGGENSDEYWNALIDGMSHERTEGMADDQVSLERQPRLIQGVLQSRVDW
jgi:hypothetical protein